MFSKKIKTIIGIEGMSCEHCANKVSKTLEDMEKIKSVKVSLSKKQALVTSDEKLDYDEIKKVIESLDYNVTDIKEK